MYNVRPFSIADGLRLSAPPEERTMTTVMASWGEDEWHRVVGDSLAWTLTSDDTVICFGGVKSEWFGRGIAWFCRSVNLLPYHMIRIHRFCSRMLDGLQKHDSYRRIDAVVRQDFPEGHRWARMLGFQAEGLMRSFDPLGLDYQMYSRIKTNG